MAKTTSSTAGLSDLDQLIGDLGQQIRERFSALRQEVSAGQKELRHLSEQHERLAGKALLDLNGHPSAKPGRKANGAAPRTRTKGKRTRKTGVTTEWLQESLSKRGMTVKQLQEMAEQAGLSGLRIPAMLKESRGKFKSEPGEAKPGVKGIPGAVWGVR